MKCYLITLTLTDGDDKTIKLVGEKTWKWILSSPKEINVDEYVPEDALVEMERLSGKKQEPTVHITSGRWDNDRAIQAGGVAFENIKDVNKWLKENRSEIDDEYNGYIY